MRWPAIKLSFSTRPWARGWAHTDADIAEWLLGGLALEIRKRLLRAEERWGKRTGAFCQDLTIPITLMLKASLFPNRPKLIPKAQVQGCIVCVLCVYHEHKPKRWSYWGGSLIFYSPYVSENYKCSLEIYLVGRSSKLDTVRWIPNSYRVGLYLTRISNWFVYWS